MTDQAIVSRIRQWLLRHPRPAFVRVFSESFDAPSDIPIGERPRWADVASDLASMEPTMLQAMDDRENILRVERVLGEAPSSAAPVPRAGDIPIPPVLSQDPETVRLTHFANLLARAYENAHASANQLTTETTAFLLNWTASMEQRYQRAEEERRQAENELLENKLNPPEEEDGGGLRSTIENAFFGGVKQPAATPEQPSRGGRVIPGWGEN